MQHFKTDKSDDPVELDEDAVANLQDFIAETLCLAVAVFLLVIGIAVLLESWL